MEILPLLTANNNKIINSPSISTYISFVNQNRSSYAAVPNAMHAIKQMVTWFEHEPKHKHEFIRSEPNQQTLNVKCIARLCSSSILMQRASDS